jgi:integrase
MATFKAEVYAHQKKADGTYNIKIRVTQNQRKKYLATTWYVTKEDLTRSLKIKNQKYIDLTDDLIKSYRKKCDRLGERLKNMSVDEVVDYIQRDKDENWDLDIVDYTWRHIKRLEETGHKGNAETYKCAIRSMVKFMGRDTISIKEITVRMLTKWAEWIATSNRITTGFSPHNYLSRIRAIHNRAKKEYNDEDAGIIRIPNSPFSHIEMPKAPTPEKRAISLDKMRELVHLSYIESPYPNTNRFNFALDLFILSFGLVGMNAVDLYDCTDCKNGRITYERKKTRNRRADRALISIKIEPEIEDLVRKYRDPSGQRVFKFYKIYSSMDTFSRAINIGLKKIATKIGVDELEFYAARHTWATIAQNDAEIDKWTVHTALNHIDDTTRITDTYIKKSWDPIDRANRKVFDLVGIDRDFSEPLLPKQK